jgi:hypothetical protein
MAYLLNWVDFKKINWSTFSENHNAFHYLAQSPKKIRLYNFSKNINDDAVEFLIRHPQYIDWRNFSSNYNNKAVNYMLNNYRKLNQFFKLISSSNSCYNNHNKYKYKQK